MSGREEAPFHLQLLGNRYTIGHSKPPRYYSMRYPKVQNRDGRPVWDGRSLEGPLHILSSVSGFGSKLVSAAASRLLVQHRQQWDQRSHGHLLRKQLK